MHDDRSDSRDRGSAVRRHIVLTYKVGLIQAAFSSCHSQSFPFRDVDRERRDRDLRFDRFHARD